jgi:hypothetical protein
MRRLALTFALAAALTALASQPVRAWQPHPNVTVADRIATRHAQTLPWHGPYYHTQWGNHVALIVPPTARTQVNWGWGVTQSSMTPLYHQYSRLYPGETGYTVGGDQCLPTPQWPSHTSQFGVYYVRGPWGRGPF